MIAIDTNILVYSHRRESRYHDRALVLVRDLAEGVERWAIPWPCIYEFFSVVTNRRIWRESASTAQQAWRQIEAWSGSPACTLLNEPEEFLAILEPLITRARVRGPIVHDARVAAICIAHGVDELLTADRDFSLFPELPARNPLL